MTEFDYIHVEDSIDLAVLVHEENGQSAVYCMVLECADDGYWTAGYVKDYPGKTLLTPKDVRDTLGSGFCETYKDKMNRMPATTLAILRMAKAQLDSIRESHQPDLCPNCRKKEKT